MKKILIVDDNLDILELLKIRLQQFGYEVITTKTGEESLNLLKKETPDIILLDLLLPNIQGEEVCKQIKTDDTLKHIPVILFTVRSGDVEKIAKQLGAEDYIRKPFEPEDLLAKIKNFIG